MWFLVEDFAYDGLFITEYKDSEYENLVEDIEKSKLRGTFLYIIKGKILTNLEDML